MIFVLFPNVLNFKQKTFSPGMVKIALSDVPLTNVLLQIHTGNLFSL